MASNLIFSCFRDSNDSDLFWIESPDGRRASFFEGDHGFDDLFHAVSVALSYEFCFDKDNYL